MIKTKQEVEEKRLQVIQLQARINKLKAMEDQAKRHMQDAKRKTEFISTMRDEKAKKREDKDKQAMEEAMKAAISKKKIQEEREAQLKQLKHSKFST